MVMYSVQVGCSAPLIPQSKHDTSTDLCISPRPERRLHSCAPQRVNDTTITSPIPMGIPLISAALTSIDPLSDASDNIHNCRTLLSIIWSAW